MKTSTNGKKNIKKKHDVYSLERVILFHNEVTTQNIKNPKLYKI